MCINNEYGPCDLPDGHVGYHQHLGTSGLYRWDDSGSHLPTGTLAGPTRMTTKNKGWLKPILEEARKDVESRPQWQQNRRKKTLVSERITHAIHSHTCPNCGEVYCCGNKKRHNCPRCNTKPMPVAGTETKR